MSDQARDWELSFYNREDRIAELVDTNRLLCRDLDEAQRVVEARDERIDELQAELKEAETLQFKAYCAGYESGHHDTVETNYSPPVDYPEEWEGIIYDLRAEEQNSAK